jgi:hypothetical protein
MIVVVVMILIVMKVIVVVVVVVMLLLLLLLLLSLVTGFLPGTSVEAAVIPTAQVSSFALQYFP